MKKNVFMPKYLTKEMADKAIQIAVDTVFRHQNVKREHAHVVVLIPAMVKNELEEYPSKYSSKMVMLHEKSFGKESKVTMWEHEYDEIARCKALQLAEGRNSGGSNLETPIHLLYPGDTPYWGGDIIEGIVVACSGLQPWFDKLISRITASSLVAMAREAFENSCDREEKLDFLMERESQIQKDLTRDIVKHNISVRCLNMLKTNNINSLKDLTLKVKNYENFKKLQGSSKMLFSEIEKLTESLEIPFNNK